MEAASSCGKPDEGMSRSRRPGESDGLVVPEKPANNAGTAERHVAESVEGRSPAKGKSAQGNPPRTQFRYDGGLTGLRRIREKATRRDGEKFVNLYNHLRVDLLREVFTRLRKQAAPGVDGETWADYEANLEERLVDLQHRLHRMAWRPSPVRRAFIPKADGRQRPLGIPTIEDKVVQGAVVALLTPIYEADFRDCSYGFRPRRNQHMALWAVDQMLYQGYTNWVLDADVRGYFDSIPHDRLVQLLEHRIGDPRLLRLIRRWLKAGVLEDGQLHATTEGTPQGGLVSPLLANVYLHYVLDEWTEEWRRGCTGKVHLVRYADDFLVGFQHHHEATAYLVALRARFEAYGLTLHPEKTRLIRFGMFARQDCGQDGLQRPATFDFLGFTHYCAQGRGGRLVVGRRTSKKKRTAKLAALKAEVRKRMCWKLVDQWRWLCSVLRGHFRYYAVPTNFAALASFRQRLRSMWHRALQRRSQRAAMTRARLNLVDQRFPLPKPRILHRERQWRFAL